MSASAEFAEFIDSTLRTYAESGTFRAALHSEVPGAPQRIATICPAHHKHDLTGTCYANHGCRCDGCRAGSSRRQKQARTRRAVAEWRRLERKSA